MQACLNFLLAKGVAVEEIRADEIHEGNMKEGDTRDNTDLDSGGTHIALYQWQH